MSYYEVSLGGNNLNLDDQAWIVVECADCRYFIFENNWSSDMAKISSIHVDGASRQNDIADI